MAALVPLTPAQRKLVEDNQPLAKFLARNRWNMFPEVLDYEELESLAYQGLVSAALNWRDDYHDQVDENYQPRAGFAGYAKTRIVGAILDWQKRDADHVPRSYRTDYKILQRAGYPEKKDYNELSSITGVTFDRIKLVVAAVERTPISFHEILDDNGDSVMSEPVSSHNVEDSVILTGIAEALANRVSQLPEFQQVILALRYFEMLELQVIAAQLGTSLTSVRDAHNSALIAVREAIVAAATD